MSTNVPAYLHCHGDSSRGRWGCKVGRNRDATENTVAEDGEMRFDYLQHQPGFPKGIGGVHTLIAV